MTIYVNVCYIQTAGVGLTGDASGTGALAGSAATGDTTCGCIDDGGGTAATACGGCCG